MSIQQMFLGGSGFFSTLEMSGGNNSGNGYTYTFGGKTYKVHTFLSDGTLTVTGEGEYEALLVGGGGGGRFYGGGGGGGGIIHVGAGTGGPKTISAGNYTVEVGDGGSGSAGSPTFPAPTITNDGKSSTFDGYTATGGGAGGGYNNKAARAGANGGGNGAYFTTTVQGVTPALPNNDTHAVAHGGYTGGTYNNATGAGDGHGGGAGSGQNGYTNSYVNSVHTPPHGGSGTQITWTTIYSLTGAGDNTTGLYWGGGGGGPNSGGNAGNGGTGGGGGGGVSIGTPGTGGGSALNAGGNGGNGTSIGADGGANTGGGAGGSYWPSNYGVGSGGSGIVIIRYRI